MVSPLVERLREAATAMRELGDWHAQRGSHARAVYWFDHACLIEVNANELERLP